MPAVTTIRKRSVLFSPAAGLKAELLTEPPTRAQKTLLRIRLRFRTSTRQLLTHSDCHSIKYSTARASVHSLLPTRASRCSIFLRRFIHAQNTCFQKSRGVIPGFFVFSEKGLECKK